MEIITPKENEIRELRPEEVSMELFAGFRRHQLVTKCWRKSESGWIVVDDPFVDDWTQQEYVSLVEYLRHTLQTGGVVYGLLEAGKLKGFASVEGEPFGSEKQYLDLTNIHVSEEMRGQGIGRGLMEAAKGWAKNHGARKLYISAHSSVESQAFYRAMGCREAEEYSSAHVEQEPCDCQLELPL